MKKIDLGLSQFGWYRNRGQVTLRNTERVLHNKTVDKVLEIESKGDTKIEDIVPYVSGLVGKEMLEDGDVEKGVLSAGQSMGFIRNIPTCRELPDRIMAEAEQIINDKFAQAVAQPARN